MADKFTIDGGSLFRQEPGEPNKRIVTATDDVALIVSGVDGNLDESLASTLDDVSSDSRAAVVNAITAQPASVFDPQTAALITNPATDTRDALNTVYVPVAKTVADVQDAIDAAVLSSNDLLVTTGPHLSTIAVGNDADSLTVLSPLTVRGERGSELVLDPASPGHSALRHFFRIGDFTSGPDDVVVENVTIDVNQFYINKWSRIVSRQVAAANAYCQVVTETPHNLAVGDVVTITGAELTSLNGTFTVSEVPDSVTFRVVGPTSVATGVISQAPYFARVYMTVGNISGVIAITDGTGSDMPDHVRVRDSVISNTSNAVRATRLTTDSGATHYRDWIVERVRGENFTNKAVEFGFVDGGKVIDSEFINTSSGPQAIFWSRNIEFRSNRVSYYQTGINITSGSHDVLIVGNTVEAQSNIPTSQDGPALYIRTENTSGYNYDSYNIKSIGNVYRNRMNDSEDALRFRTESAVASSVFRDMSFTDDTFDGIIYLYSATNKANTTIHGLRFDRCKIGGLVTEAYSTSKVYDVVFENCDFTDSTAMTINASNIQFINCRFASDVTISASASDVVMTGCVTPTAITNNGTGSVLTNNRVAPVYPLP